jgi:hypothetical protein
MASRSSRRARARAEQAAAADTVSRMALTGVRELLLTQEALNTKVMVDGVERRLRDLPLDVRADGTVIVKAPMGATSVTVLADIPGTGDVLRIPIPTEPGARRGK